MCPQIISLIPCVGFVNYDVVHDEEQRGLDIQHFWEVGKHHQAHELQLHGIRVIGTACLLAHGVCRVTVNDDHVSDTTYPPILILVITSLAVRQ